MKRHFLLSLVVAVVAVGVLARADEPVPFQSSQDVAFQREGPNLGDYTVDCALWPATGLSGTFGDVPLAGPQYFHPGNGVPSLIARTLTDGAGNSFYMEIQALGDAQWVDDAGIHVHMRGKWRILDGDGPYRDLRGHGDVDAVIDFIFVDGVGWLPSTGHNNMTGQVSTSSRP